MELSAVERDITNTVVKRFLRDSKPSPRNTLAREYRFSQFHRLTGWNILTNTVLGILQQWRVNKIVEAEAAKQRS